MREPMQWTERYEKNDLPWETGRHDVGLAAVVAEFPVKPCKAFEIGCGTGNNAIWLARQGFSVTATDLSDKAIAMAKEKGASQGQDIDFVSANILVDPVPGAPFAFAFDRGCFHSFDSPEELTTFAHAVATSLSEGGLWLTLMGSTDGPARETGPPRRSAMEIASVVEPLFEILCLKSTVFDSEMEPVPRAWSCLMRKRA
jgi:SAM-dependent methyltransferase